MLGPAHLKRISWFHPVGNTTPVCLTQTLPPDNDAGVLMLGCGDVRNVLFTVYSDLSINNRRIDFTCCDIEYEILARNVMLYTLLLLRSEGDIQKSIFNIYYDVMIDYDALQLLRWQAKRLYNFAQSVDRWHATPYGKYIRFLDAQTLWNCRRMWETYSTGPENGSQFLDIQNKLRYTITTAQDLQSHYVENRKSYNGIKATAPVSLYSAEIMALRYNYYWHRGVTKLSDPPSMIPLKEDCMHMNPMFATRQPSLVMHHGTDPYRSMHMSTAFLPLTEDSPLDPVITDDIDRLYDAAVTQFKAYAHAFRENIKNICIRVVNADAIAFCHALQRYALLGDPQNSGLYRSGWGFEPLTLGYMMPGDQVAFDVIDTSNLADHVGCLNIISAASPLLTPNHTSTLRVETAIIRDGQGPESGIDILGGHFTAMSSIFGLNCMHFWTQNGNTPIFPEQILADLPGSDFHGQSVYCRSVIEWHHMGAESKIKMNEIELANLMAGMYLEMFGDENPQSRTPRRHRFQQYTRATFLAAVGAIKRAVHVSDWSEVLKELLGFIKEECTLDVRYKEDLYLQFHLQGLHTETRFISYMDKAQTGLLSQWLYIPPAICLTMVIPRENLDFLEENLPSTSLVAQMCLMTANEYNHSEYDCFQSVQLCLGSVHATGKRFTDEYIIKVHPDGSYKGWEGIATRGNTPLGATSDLIASVMIPTYKVLGEPSLNFDVAFAIRNTTNSEGDLIVFRDRIDGKNVFLTQHQPHLSGPTWAPTLNPRTNDYRPPIYFQPHYDNQDREDDFAPPDLDTYIELSARTLLSEEPARIECISAFQHIAQIPGWKGGEQTDVEIFLPMPVISDMSSCESGVRPLFGKLKYSGHMPSVELLFQKPSTLFPMFLDQGKPILQNLHYINLDKLPILNVSHNHDYAWVEDHITSTLSYKEEIDNNSMCLEDSRYHCDIRVKFKNSLFHIFQSFIQSRPSRLPCLITNKTEGPVFLLCPSNVRLDLSNKTIVLDCAVAHLNKSSLPYLRPWFEGPTALTFRLIEVGDDELLMWKHTLPAFAERCRTWSHSPSCEYQSTKKIPLSTEKMERGAFCSCAYAFSRDSTFDIGDTQLWSCLRSHAVRVVLTLPFPFPFGPASLDTDVETWVKRIKPCKRRHPMEGRTRDLRWCSACARTEDEEMVVLEKCGGCKKVWYCSEICVYWDWHYGGHRIACGRLKAQY